MSFSITVRCGGKELKIEYSSPVRLTDVLAKSGFSFDLPCGGCGICGNCKVAVCGCVSEISDIEKDYLGDAVNNGLRLACMVNVTGDAIIDIPTSFLPEDMGKSRLTVRRNPITNRKKCFACAVDIGTTTIILRYYSLPEGRIIFTEHVPNPQRIRGADILTRIQYASNSGLNELNEMLNSAINESAIRFGHEVEYYVITGNTAMLHILSGRNPCSLAVAPFKPETLFGFWEGNRYYMRCASAYIGADVVASVIASEICNDNTPSVMLDIGTNSECVLWNGEKLYACSAPAGPAFEGANISCGMAAASGAIYRIDGNDVYTLGDSDALGFCGSGLIDAVAYLLKNEYIAKDGSVIKTLPDFKGVHLTPEDIAELQLAKSAVCAGLLTLCDKTGVLPQKLYLTGSFGNKINTENAEFIGLIPKDSAKHSVSSACGAIDGASMVLLNKDIMDQSLEIADSIETVELADSSFFEKAFIENMYF